MSVTSRRRLDELGFVAMILFVIAQPARSQQGCKQKGQSGSSGVQQTASASTSQRQVSAGQRPASAAQQPGPLAMQRSTSPSQRQAGALPQSSGASGRS